MKRSGRFYIIDIKDCEKVFDYEAYKNYFREEGLTKPTFIFIDKMKKLKEVYNEKKYKY